MKVALILSYAAAEQAVQALAERRYRGKTVEAIQADARGRWKKLVGVGRRMLQATADVGVALEALKAKSPHGTYLERLHKLGISSSSADNCRKVACYRAALPKNPPAELYGTVWTDQAALEFGKQLFDIPDDIPEGERLELAVQAVQKKRARIRRVSLSSKVLKLETELSVALHEDALDAGQAIAVFIAAAQRLNGMARQLADEGVRQQAAQPEVEAPKTKGNTQSANEEKVLRELGRRMSRAIRRVNKEK